MLQQEYDILKDFYWSELIRSKTDISLDPYTAFSFAFDNAYNMCKQMWSSEEDEPDKIFNKSQDSANCDNHIVQDHELVDHFAEARNMLRVKIAAQFAIVIMTGPGEHFNYYLPGSHFPSLIGRKFISEVNRVALLYADDLIAQSMKGGAE